MAATAQIHAPCTILFHCCFNFQRIFLSSAPFYLQKNTRRSCMKVLITGRQVFWTAVKHWGFLFSSTPKPHITSVHKLLSSWIDFLTPAPTGRSVCWVSVVSFYNHLTKQSEQHVLDQVLFYRQYVTIYCVLIYCDTIWVSHDKKHNYIQEHYYTWRHCGR